MLRNIVIDLDMLLDTRAGTLRRLIPKEEVDALVNTEAYRMRNHERMWELCSVTREAWEAGWAARDEVTLAKSEMTLMLADFPKFVADLNSVATGNNPALSDVRFLINTYPYKIRPIFKQRIASAAQYNFATTCEVETLALDYSRLSPEQCKSRNIIQMFVYDITAYCKACFPDDINWSTSNMPTPNEELVIITPKIVRDEFETQRETEELGVELPKGIADFNIAAELLSLIFGVEFVNTSYSCQITKEVTERIKKGREDADSTTKSHQPNSNVTSTVTTGNPYDDIFSRAKRT